MVKKLREENAANFTGLAGVPADRSSSVGRLTVIGPGVVDDFSGGAGSNHDHRMPWRRLAKLAIEEQVAGLRRVHIAADKIRVPLDQRACVGKLGEGTV